MVFGEERTTNEIHERLGKYLFYEHVKNNNSFLGSFFIFHLIDRGESSNSSNSTGRTYTNDRSVGR